MKPDLINHQTVIDAELLQPLFDMVYDALGGSPDPVAIRTALGAISQADLDNATSELASDADLALIDARVTSAESSIADKADRTEVDALSADVVALQGAVSGIESNIATIESQIQDRPTFLQVVDYLFPIGSCFISYTGDDPTTRFPGTTWVKIPGGTTLAQAEAGEPLGSYGGSNEHTLTADEIAHTHNLPLGFTASHLFLRKGATGTPTWGQASYPSELAHRLNIDTEVTGAYAALTSPVIGVTAQPHNNRPRYMAVDIWLRTA